MSALSVRATASEQMDAGDLDPAVYARILADLSRVNRVTLARRPTLAFLGRLLHRRDRFSLLDVGFGQGDMLRSIAHWAARRKHEARLIGIDLNPRSAPVATAATPAALRIHYRTGDHRTLSERFDVIVSSLVAHHMRDDELIEFLRWMERTARRGWMINDLHRHRLSHAGYPVLARLLGWHRIVREDGTLSIARSFRPREWHALLAAAGIEGARVVRRFPFRLCVERIR